MNDFQKFVALSRYARWLSEENRRETWDETVSRYIDNVVVPVLTNTGKVDAKIIVELEDAIVNLRVLPSMRCMMSAGPALDRCNVAAFNCSALPVDSPRSFDESMYILMCGTGVGFSVEQQYVSQLPIINEHFEKTNTIIKVADSKAGWARALRELIALLYSGQVPQFDMSLVRPAGARLKTFGGRASGPEPLNGLFTFCIELFQKAAGRRLTPLECHDIMCKIGEVVVVGGVRRSAMISLSDLSDTNIAKAKHGAWWEQNGQRALANNSAVYTVKPSVGDFLSEWSSLYESKSGERGIFNRQAAKQQAERNGRRDSSVNFLTNPCGEILLRPYGVCNLTEAVVRATDSLDDLKNKVRLAAILGTIQSTLIDFKYLRKIWRQNAEEERLLGVSLTGILDHPTLWKDEETLETLRQVAIDTNYEYANILSIPISTAINCVKPSGTVSQLVDAASGIHPRWSQYYIRTVRADNKDPLTIFMKDIGIPYEPDVTKPEQTTVFSFPQKAPAGAIVRRDLSAIDHLEIWKTNKESWCEHNPSITVNVREQEWVDVGAWVYKNFDMLSGVSFLPMDEHTYRQAPYQEITETEYNEWMLKMPKDIDWGRLTEYEKEDTTTGTQEYACSGSGVCELVDIT